MALAAVCGLFGATGALNHVPAAAAIHTDGPAVLAAAPPCTNSNHWQTAPDMIAYRQSAAAVAADGYVFVLGGNAMGSLRGMADVERAAIGADGALGAWITTTALSGPNTGLAAVAVNGYVYAVGGLDYPIHDGQALDRVEGAAILADGQLGAWEAQPPLPAGRLGHQVVATSNQIYVLGGITAPFHTSSRDVLRADIISDGSLGPWVASSPMLRGRLGSGAVIVGSFIYVIGGSGVFVPGGIDYSEPGPWNTVERAEINPDGSLGAWQELPLLEHAIMGGRVMASDGYLYAIGGEALYQNEPSGAVERAAILPNGSLGPWEYVDPLLTARARFSGASFNGHLYVMGGDQFIAGRVIVPSVEQVATSELAALSANGLTINDSAWFTNQTAVTLTISGQPGTVEMQVSNHPNFAGAAWQACVAALPWTISQTGSSTLPRVVYAQFRDAEGVVSGMASDDIFLDVTAPTGTLRVAPLGLAALAGGGPADLPANVLLSLSATDDVSGVGSMEIGNDPALADGLWEPYAASKAWHLPVDLNTVYVRFRDGAGNISSVFSGHLPSAIFLPLIRRNP